MDIRAKKSNVQENNGSVLFLPLNRIFLLSFCFSPVCFILRNGLLKKIDRLQDKIGSQYMQEGRIYEGIEQTKKAIQLSDEINYTKGRARGYIHMVNFLHSWESTVKNRYTCKRRSPYIIHLMMILHYSQHFLLLTEKITMN